MRKTSLYAVAMALLLLGAACSKNVSVNNNTEVNVHAGNDNVNSAVNSSTSTNVNVNANIAGDNGPTVNGTLRVDTPQQNKQLESPFAVQGKSQATEVFVRIKNAAGTALFTITSKVRGGEFNSNITYNFTHTTTGTVEVFEKNSSGAEVNLISIPVTYRIDSANSSNTNTSLDAGINVNAGVNVNY